MSSITEELTVYGYVRDLLNDEDDYKFIIAIIIAYTKQGFAKYFEEEWNANFMKEMKFGDIVKRLDDDIMVMNEEHSLQKVGYYEEERLSLNVNIRMDIPASISKQLTNAVSFYSIFNRNDSNKFQFESELDDMDCPLEFDFYLLISHDDRFIINKLGGPLKPDYEWIKYHANNGVFNYLKIKYAHDRHKTYDAIDLKSGDWNYKDMIKFHEIRLNKDNVTKIHVKGTGLRKVPFVSNSWEFKDQRDAKQSQDMLDQKKRKLQ